MSFCGVTDGHGPLVEDMEVNMSNGNATLVLQSLGYEIEGYYFEADIDEFIGALLTVRLGTDPFLDPVYRDRQIRRLLDLACHEKAHGATKIIAC
jgi:hypothetical protein